MDKLVFAVGSEGVKDLGIVHLTKAELVELMASDDGMCIDCQEVTDRSIVDVVPTGGRVLPPPPNKEISHRAAVTRLGLWDRQLDHGVQLALTVMIFDASGGLVFIGMSYRHIRYLLIARHIPVSPPNNVVCRVSSFNVQP